MSTRGKLRRARRRLICQIKGHDWAEWEPSPLPSDPQEYRECLRCPAVEWRSARNVDVP